MISKQLCLSLLLILVIISLVLFAKPSSYQAQLADQAYSLEIVDTAAERQQGLSGRQSLKTKHGLLFVYPELGDHGIWMKDMNFAIDIIWLNDHQQVVGLASDVQPSSYPRVWRVPRLSQYIIEINSGQIDSLGLTIGDQVDLNQPALR